MSDKFSHTGFVRLGNDGSERFPFAKPGPGIAGLYVFEDRLILSSFFRTWLFPKASVRRLIRNSGGFFFGLRIQHAIQEYDPLIVFWTRRFDRLEKGLEQRGYIIHPYSSLPK